MAEETGYPEGSSSVNLPSMNEDLNIMNEMTVPETIKVSEEINMDDFGRDRVGYQGAGSMIVPERIVLDGQGAESLDRKDKSGFARELQSNGVNLDSYMGGLATPPRTLTVDDTTSRYHDRKSGSVDTGNFKIKANGRKNVAKNNPGVGKGERLYQDYVHDPESDSENLNFKLQTEIVRLSKRVTWLERKVEEKQSYGLWRTSLICLLTVINPIIVHWLFSRRR